ncbi:protein kinase [Ancylothrix sp. C2]|uniref:protein kinase domain-containing protein n=1 Tax=Ancylothrix sp. D3o TaxID=2953691 RepID=UPI0021BA8DEC|nr:protein kinase [Ancylothrix sp. D3o]MCT7951003.1 protein kinase [Ancylothrix sp. D3o]
MSYCINPKCTNRLNLDNLANCQTCGNSLLINNRYRLLKPLRELDEFCPTEIFEIEDQNTRKVLKILKRPKWSEMFQREARVLQQLKHPGIPQVEIDGYFTLKISPKAKELHCLVMEKIEGLTLEQWVEKYGKIPQKIAVDWLKQLVEILKVLHEKDLFHRDLKPSNCMVKPTGQLVLIDFGSVREITGTYLAKVGTDRQITGIVSPGYTPPEQATGKAVPQSDFFALGRTFVHLLTEKHPVELSENPQTGKLMWHEAAPQVSAEFANLIDNLMATIPAKRPANAQAILERIEFIKNNKISFLKAQRWLARTGLLFLGFAGIAGFSDSVAKYYYNRGLENHISRQTEQAEIYYRQALKFNPNYAEVHNALGFICQDRQDLTCARFEYEKAISLNPNLAIAHFNLATTCEELLDRECARQAYQQASKNGLITADNNLARLYLLSEDYQSAERLILQALKQTKDNHIKYSLLKNLGWAKLGQKRYIEAQGTLKQAVQLNSQQAGAYCLLAQVLEAQNQLQTAKQQWGNCLRYASIYNQDEAAWIDMARERLNSAREEK